MNNSNNNKLFYLIWRDKFLRKSITSNKFNNKTIRLHKSYLDENYQHLLLLDTDNYDIFLQYVVQKDSIDSLDEFINHPHRNVINSINIYFTDIRVLQDSCINSIDTLTQFQVVFQRGPIDLKIVPSSVTDLSLCYKGDWTFYRGPFPPALKKLDLQKLECEFDGPSVGEFPNSLTSLSVGNYNLLLPEQLPCSLVSLNLSWVLAPRGSKVNVPESVTDLTFFKEAFEWPVFNVAPNRVYDGATIQVNTREDIELLNTSYPWVTNVVVYGVHLVQYLPKQIKNIEIVGNEDDPNAHMESFSSFKQLTYLKWKMYDSPAIGLIPNTLKVLHLVTFDQMIMPGVLPESLTELYLSSFRQPITSAGVIPSRVEKLVMKDISRISAGVFPNSIKEMTIYPEKLIVPKNVLPNSLVKFIAHFRTLPTIYIPAPFGQNIYLPSSITELSLILTPMSFVGNQYLKANTLPPNVRYLDLIYILLDTDMIPDSCTVLSTNSPNLDQIDLPPSVTELYITDIENIDYIPPNIKLLQLNHRSNYNCNNNKSITVRQNDRLYTFK